MGENGRPRRQKTSVLMNSEQFVQHIRWCLSEELFRGCAAVLQFSMSATYSRANIHTRFHSLRGRLASSVHPTRHSRGFLSRGQDSVLTTAVSRINWGNTNAVALLPDHALLTAWRSS